VKYSFKQQDMNNWKGRITESLTRFYIRDVLCPKLEKEGWFKVLFLPSIPLLIPSRPIEELSASKRDFYRDKYISLRTILLGKGIYPSQEFLEKCGRVNDFLKHLSDGILLKFRKTGEMKQMRDLISEIGTGEWRYKWGNKFEESDEIRFSTKEVEETTEIPIVNGEIEVVEVKSDKGKLSKVQKEDYSNLVKNGYPLRLFHVSIVSFDKNHFEVKEKLLRTINEVEKGLVRLKKEYEKKEGKG